MNKIIEDLNWRYATKKYDTTKKISTEDFNTIKESLRLSPSSYGLQPLKYIIIENKELREELKSHSFNQSQITDASHMIVFCSLIDIKENHIDQYIENIAKTRSQEVEKIVGFGDYMKKEIFQMDKSILANWNSKQAYIALGQVLHTCANLRIDATPMEGFKADKYDEILGLKEQNLKSILVCAFGYRSIDDVNSSLLKVRKSHNDLFYTIL
jgi:nitroreductase